MCWALYLASDIELPWIPWNENDHGFFTMPLSEYELGVAAQFSLPHMVYLGSHQGCGCGFFTEDSEDSEEVAQKDETMRRLVGYLHALLAQGAHLEMFLCWEGDQDAAPVARKTLALAAFTAPVFPVGEKELALINA